MKETWRCPHCGVVYVVDSKDYVSLTGGSGMGFVWACFRNHIYRCQLKTWGERRKWLREAKRRWKHRPPKYHIRLDDLEPEMESEGT